MHAIRYRPRAGILLAITIRIIQPLICSVNNTINEVAYIHVYTHVNYINACYLNASNAPKYNPFLSYSNAVRPKEKIDVSSYPTDPKFLLPTLNKFIIVRPFFKLH
jgi:hypothetical protein